MLAERITLEDLNEHLVGHLGALTALVRRRLDDPELAADVLQESLLKAIKRVDQLEDEDRLLPWLYRILRRTIILEALDLGGESTQHMAERLGITTNNLKVRRHRARKQLRQRLEETCRVCAAHGCLDCTCGESA